MSALKCKSSIALIIGIVAVLLLIPIWYTMVVPFMMASEIEKIDSTNIFEGTLGKQGYLFCQTKYGKWALPIRIEAHAYVDDVKGDNVVLKIEMNIIRTDTNKTLPELSTNSTYVFNKFTRQNVWSSDADKNRTGYDPLYPPDLKANENVSNVWLDNLNSTATIEFKESTVEDGVKLYKYFVNETIKKPVYVPDVGLRNSTLTSTKTVLVEPLSGFPAYTESETFDWTYSFTSPYATTKTRLIYLTYNSTAETKSQGISTAKAAYEGMQLLEFYLPSILGIIVIILTIGLALNLRRLERKKPH